MLEILRQRSSSIATKFIFGIIIMVFVFFYGYNKLDNSRGGSTSGAVAEVDGQPISEEQFQFLLDQQYQMYQQIFKDQKGGLTKEMMKDIEKSVMEGLVSDMAMEHYAKKLGLEASPLQIATSVKSLPAAKNDKGEFDKERYIYLLQNYKKRFGLDLEALISNDETRANLRKLFMENIFVPPAEVYQRFLFDRSRWSFEVIEIDGKALIEAKKAATDEEVKKMADEIHNLWKEPSKQLLRLKDLGVEVKKIGPISMAQRQELLPSAVDQKELISVFTLTPQQSVAPSPISFGGKHYSIKFVKMESPSKDDWEKEKDAFTQQTLQSERGSLFAQWAEQIVEKADKKIFLTPDK